MAIQIGIFLAIGFRECASVSWEHIRSLPSAVWYSLQGYVSFFVNGLRRILVWSLGGLLRVLVGFEDEQLTTFDLTSVTSTSN